MDTRRRPILAALPCPTCVAALALFWGFAASSALAQTPGYHVLGYPPTGAGGYAAALSADGRVAAGFSQGGTVGSPGFTWSEEAGRYDFGLLEPAPQGRLARPAAISGDGTTVVGQRANTEAFRWSGLGTFQNLGFLGSHQQSAAHGVSGDGSIVVGRAYSTQSSFGQAWRWTQSGGMQGLGFTREGHIYSEANGISRDGNVIVGMSQSSSGGTDAFAWTSAIGMRILPVLPTAFDAYAYGTNHDGSIIVGACGGFAVRWSGDLVHVLSSPPGLSARATRTSDDGSVVLGVLFNATSTPSIWTPASGWQLPADYFAAQGFPVPAAWSITSVNSISADGRTFAGTYGIGIDGFPQAFVLTVPAPGAIVLLGAFAVSHLRRRRV
jgi:probable HAF family extracellular repeat protein